MNENKIHGPSTLVLIKTEEWHRAAISEECLKDSLFEIVYCARETFSDGASCIKVCWRVSDKQFHPSLKKTKTYLTGIVWEV